MSLLAIPSGTSSNAGGFYPYEIDGSLRFNDDDSAYLSRTGTAGNSSVWTLSFWMKPSGASSGQVIFGAGPDGSNLTRIDYRADKRFQIFNSASGVANGSLVFDPYKFRDPSAWYHFVFVVNTPASETDRYQFYVNGERLTGISSTPGENTYPSVSATTQVNTAVSHEIGRRIISNSEYFDGYLAEMHFTDGTAYDADDFGETKNGVWVAKKPSVAYGTNGFHLEFAGNANDSSGNGNNWTANNITSDDYVSDSPTDNFCTLNSVFATSNSASTGGTLSEGNLRITTTGGFFKAGTFAVNSGKWYFEGTAIDLGAQLSISFADLDAIQTGYSYVGYLSLGGLHEIDGTAQDAQGTHPTYTSNDVIGVAIDVDAGKIWWSKNNSWIDSGDPATGANPPTTFTANTTVVPYFMCDNASGTKTWEANFGQLGFTYTPPTGFNALSTANLPDPAIDPAEDNSPEDYFNTSLWTGNSSTQAITGVGFSPDLIWMKRRSAAANHTLVDSVRGITKTLEPNVTGAEETQATTITAIGSDGYTLGSRSQTNGSGNTYVGWSWRGSDSSPVSNTDGSITSTVSANTDAGFSIVSYTGTGSNATVGHGLDSAPDFMIVRNRIDASNWRVYHSALPATQYMTLNLTNSVATGSGAWNNTAPTDSVFSIGTAGDLNGSGDGSIAYCFHSVEGFSKFGSYTGNGSADGPFVYTGFRPAWVVVKPSSITGSWQMFDTARDEYNIANARLDANSSSAESSNDRIDIISNGFKVRNTAGGFNDSGATFIYMAFAETPFKYSVGR